MGKRTTERLFASVELDGTNAPTVWNCFKELTGKLEGAAASDRRRVLWDTLGLSTETEVDEDITFVGGMHTERRMLTGSVLAVKL